MYLFSSLDQVRWETERWLHIYNHIRPHHALGGLTPVAYLQRYFQTQKATDITKTTTNLTTNKRQNLNSIT